MTGKDMVDKYFKEFLDGEGFAPAIDCRPVDEKTLQLYKGRLPDQLLSYWREFGFCGYGEGLFWTVNPAEYEDLLGMWLGNTSLWNREKYHVIARTAFGEMYVIGEESLDDTIINPHLCNILPGDPPEKILSNDEKSRYIGIFFDSQDKDSLDIADINDKPLFKRVLEKLGPLKYDEMYTFVPALATGGKADIENVQITKLYDQLALLSELDTPVILKSVSELF